MPRPVIRSGMALRRAASQRPAASPVNAVRTWAGSGRCAGAAEARGAWARDAAGSVGGDGRMPEVVAAWEGNPLPVRMQQALRRALRRLHAEDRECSSLADEPIR